MERGEGGGGGAIYAIKLNGDASTLPGSEE